MRDWTPIIQELRRGQICIFKELKTRGEWKRLDNYYLLMTGKQFGPDDQGTKPLYSQN